MFKVCGDGGKSTPVLRLKLCISSIIEIMGDDTVEMTGVVVDQGEAALAQGSQVAVGAGAKAVGEVVQESAPFMMALVSFIVGLLNLFVDIFRTMLNVSLIAVNFTLVLPKPDLHFEKVDNAMEDLAKPLKSLAVTFRKMVESVDFLDVGLQNWQCGGVSRLLELIFLMIAMVLIFVFFEKDVLIRLAVTSRRRYAGAKKARKLLFKGVTAMVVSMAFYCLQYAALIIPGLLIAISRDAPNCGKFDVWLLDVTKYIRWLIFGLVVVFYAMIFASDEEGMKQVKKTIQDTIKKAKSDNKGSAALFGMALGILVGIRYLPRNLWRIMEVTFGVWNEHSAEAYEIVERAEKHDDDPEDDNNCHEEVMGIMGKQVGLFWCTIPLMAILTKVGEYSNNSVVWTLADRIVPRSSKVKRSVKYGAQILKLILMIFTALLPSLGMVIALNISLLPSFFVDVWEGIYNAYSAASKAVGGAVGGAVDDAAALVENVEVGEIAEQAQDIGAGVMEQAKEIGGEVAEQAKEIGGEVAEQAKEVGGEVAEQAKEIGGEVAEQAKEIGGEIAEQAKEIGGEIAEQAKEIGGEVAEQAKEIGGEIAEQAKEIGGEVAEQAKEVGGEIAEQAKEIGGEALDKAEEVVEEHTE